MNDIPIGYYRAENGMLKQSKPETAATSEAEKIDITDKDVLRKLALETVVSVIRANPTSLAVVPALRELWDRIDGKAPQSIAMTVKKAPVDLLPADVLAALVAQLPDPIIIPPMPDKLDMVD